jgi:hypothetical protein
MILMLLVALQVQNGPPPDDEYISGYATAILERDFDAKGKVEVHDGVVTIRSDLLKEQDREKAVTALSRIRGVKRVDLLPPDAPVTPARPPEEGGWTLFPEGRLFDPLLADPRWPHFGITYAHYHRSTFPPLINVAQVDLGEQFTVVGADAGSIGKFDLGIQPAVFGLFNLDALSHDLVNADYQLAIPVDYRLGSFSAQATIYHQSSHLGDEFLLDTPTDRINLSYEAFRTRISMERGPFRIILGGEKLLHTETPLAPWSAEQGVEVVATGTILNGSMKPLAAVYLRERQETGWRPSVSLRAGVQLSSPEGTRRRIQLLLEYYRGDDPNGQFQAERIETVGLGLHVYF